MDVKKTHLSWADVEDHTTTIIKKMTALGWMPTVVVGLTRGGLLPATMISHYLNVDMCSLDVSLRDNHFSGGPTSTWIPEEINNGHRILVVDDINDTGATFEWIRNDWMGTVQGMEPTGNDWPWNQIKFAALVHNIPSSHPTDFRAIDINKDVDQQWICFPWETWYGKKPLDNQKA